MTITLFLGVIVLIGGVIALFKVFGLYPRAMQAVHTSRKAFDVMKHPELGDDHKETLLQQYSLSLLLSFLDLLVRGALAIFIPTALLWALQLAGVLSLAAVFDLMLSWPILVGGTLAAIVAFWLFEN